MLSFMSYIVIDSYFSVQCCPSHINSTSFQSIAFMAYTVFPDVMVQVLMVLVLMIMMLILIPCILCVWDSLS